MSFLYAARDYFTHQVGFRRPTGAMQEFWLVVMITKFLFACDCSISSLVCCLSRHQLMKALFVVLYKCNYKRRKFNCFQMQ